MSQCAEICKFWRKLGCQHQGSAPLVVVEHYGGIYEVLQIELTR